MTVVVWVWLVRLGLGSERRKFSHQQGDISRPQVDGNVSHYHCIKSKVPTVTVAGSFALFEASGYCDGASLGKSRSRTHGACSDLGTRPGGRCLGVRGQLLLLV